jgi:hypothetical protein
MWALNNRTAYAAERSWTRDKNGVHYWLVAVKATFDIRPGGHLALADEQLPPLQQPEDRGDPTVTSLRQDADLLAAKPGTDVVLDAWAHAPNGRPATSIPVFLGVGELAKTLVVHGPRTYSHGFLGTTLSAPRPFTTHPISYEWAFGGTDTNHKDEREHRIDSRNPIGKGFAIDSRHLDGKVAHAIEYPKADPCKAGPAGFGPIASFWSPRRELAGTYDARWQTSKKPLLPDDYDGRFALCSPDDQRPTRALRGGEAIVLINMTAEGTLRFDLPKIFLTFQTSFGNRTEEHRAILTTLFIATEQRKLSLVWQSALRVPARDADYLDTTIIREKPYLP